MKPLLIPRLSSFFFLAFLLWQAQPCGSQSEDCAGWSSALPSRGNSSGINSKLPELGDGSHCRNILGAAELGVRCQVSLPSTALVKSLLAPMAFYFLALHREARSGSGWEDVVFRLSQNVLDDVKPHCRLLPSLSACFCDIQFSRLHYGIQAPDRPRCLKPAVRMMPTMHLP